MKALLITGLLCILVGILAVSRMLFHLWQARQTGIGAVAGGVGPGLFCLIALGVLLLLLAGIVRFARR